jgi:hypothetical protein
MNNLVRRLFIVLSFSTLYGQNIQNISPTIGIAYLYHNDSVKRIDFHLGQLSSLHNGNWVTYDSFEVLVDPMRTLLHPAPTTHQTPDTTIISFTGTGLVYTMSKSGKLRRHDRTFYAGYHFMSLRHFDGQRLWSFGGSGLWRVVDLCIYYDPELREWERIIMDPPLVNGYADGFYSVLDSGHYVLAASSRQNFNGREMDYQIIELDLNRRSQKIIGRPRRVQEELYPQDLIDVASDGTWSLLSDEHHLYAANLGTNQLLRLSQINNNAIAFDGSNGVLMHPKGVILFETASTLTNATLKVEFTTLEAMINNPFTVNLGAVYDGLWYSTLKENAKELATILLSSILLLIYILRYQRERPKKDRDYVQSLSPHAVLLFRHLMLQSPGSYSTTEDVNRILNIEDKTWDNQRKIRSSVIQELEEKAMQILGVTSFIERIQSPEDRRVRHFRINAAFRDELLPCLKYV